MSLSLTDLRLMRPRDTVGELLDGGVQQLDHQDEHDRPDQQQTPPGALGDQEGERHREDERGKLLPKAASLRAAATRPFQVLTVARSSRSMMPHSKFGRPSHHR